MLVHEYCSDLEPGAVGAHALVVRDLLQQAGHRCEIVTPRLDPAYAASGAHLLGEVRGTPDLLLYQMGIGAEVADVLLARTEPLVVNYHNLTPSRLLAGWDPVAAHGVVWGRQQLRALAPRSESGIAVSRYNEAELVEAGFAHTAVVPFLLDLAAFGAEPDAALLERLRATRAGTEWLFVGRVAPHKAQHDLLKAFASYRRFHDADARLHLVGGGLDSAYGRALTNFASSLGLGDSVVLTGAVAGGALAAYYANADVFTVASEHEGFCVPLLESWYHRVPVVAYAAAAIPETLGDGGLLLDAKDPYTFAAAVARVVPGGPVRETLVANGSARLAQFDLAVTGPAFVETLTGVTAR
ncbi:MAG TPA: glycosyltransferase [Acidimicrobiia bacterium]|nr:glycosyltransferase [Acidimicrobiia bacterium]